MNMKLTLKPTSLMLAGLLAVAHVAAAQTTTLSARTGSKITMDGTSTIHDWTVQGTLIGGRAVVGPGFPLEPGQPVQPGKVEAKVETFIPLSSLKSVKDGKPYSDAMDNIMYEKLGSPTHRRISFHLNELILKEPPKNAESPYVFESKGELVVAGVTNALTMPVEVTPLSEGRVKFAGTTKLKMTDFNIEPPAPKLAMGAIKTGDEITIRFEWMTAAAK
jgi:hypothetical protein